MYDKVCVKTCESICKRVTKSVFTVTPVKVSIHVHGWQACVNVWTLKVALTCLWYMKVSVHVSRSLG